MTEILLGTLVLVAIVLALAAIVSAARRLLSPSGRYLVKVNGTLDLDHAAGASLLQTLMQNGVMIPSACAGAGTCGLCRVTVTAGGAAPLPTETARLSRAELRAGTRLACQVRPRGDMAVEVPDGLIGVTPVTCRVVSARFVSPLIREVVLGFPEDRPADIVAGSFLQVTAPPYGLDMGALNVPEAFADDWRSIRPLRASTDEPVTRAYSISNRPEDTAAGRAVLNIRLALPPPDKPDAPPGVVSSWLFSVRQDTPVEVTGPFGTFRAEESDREMILIGGGVGMAPLRAIVFDQLERLGADRKISFWYGARSEKDLYYMDEFEALAERHPNFSMHVALSDPRPDTAWTGATGFIHSVVWNSYLRDHPAPEECRYYLCGPPLMIRSVFAMLDDAGVERSSIFNDDFGV